METTRERQPEVTHFHIEAFEDQTQLVMSPRIAKLIKKNKEINVSKIDEFALKEFPNL